MRLLELESIGGIRFLDTYQKQTVRLPKLKRIVGDLNCLGSTKANEDSFPALEYVGGDIILYESGFTKLPPNLKLVLGKGIISRNAPFSLAYAMQEAAEQGIIKGGVCLCD